MSNKIWSVILLICAIASGARAIYIYRHESPEAIEHNRLVTVLEKYQTDAGYKVSGKFILVMRDEETKTLFSKDVSPTDFYVAEKGKQLIFKLSMCDITGNYWPSNRHDILPIVFVFIALILLVFALGFYFD